MILIFIYFGVATSISLDFPFLFLFTIENIGVYLCIDVENCFLLLGDMPNFYWSLYYFLRFKVSPCLLIWCSPVTSDLVWRYVPMLTDGQALWSLECLITSSLWDLANFWNDGQPWCSLSSPSFFFQYFTNFSEHGFLHRLQWILYLLINSIGVISMYWDPLWFLLRYFLIKGVSLKRVKFWI